MSRLMRISDETADTVDSLSKQTGESRQKIIEQAVQLYTYERLLKKANEQYAELRKDPTVWKQMQEEREIWDVTLNDGFTDDKS